MLNKKETKTIYIKIQITGSQPLMYPSKI